jgi:hypothetical protein
VRLGHHIVLVEEGHGARDAVGRARLLGIDTHHVHVIGAVQSERLAHVEGTRGVRAPIVGHHHGPPLGQRGRDSDNRAGILLHHHGERVVWRVLRFKVKKGVLAEHDEVIVLGLQENMRGWEPGILEDVVRAPCLGTPLGKAL